MAKACYLGLDVGTSGLKTILIAADGKILATNTQEYPVSSPKPSWSEQNPQHWWKAACAGIGRALADAKCRADAVMGIGLSGQMHGSVFLPESGTTPLRPAILWNDQRTSDQCAAIEKAAGGRKKLISMVANPALTGFTAPKILWLRDHESSIFKKTRHVLLPKDYLRLCLTGTYATEVSDASGTLLLDVRRRAWHTGLMKLLKLDPTWFPTCTESTDVSGILTAEAAKATGLIAGIPVVGGAGDQAAGAVGNGIVSSGVVSATLGTSGVVFAYADQPVLDPLGRVHTMCHAVPGAWCVFGCMLAAGGSLQWFRNQFGQMEQIEAKKKNVDPYTLMMKQAESAPAGCEGVIFLPYLTGERTPHADPFARASFIGMTARTDRSAMIRSVVEGITYGMRDQITIMRDMGVAIRQVRASGGGARSLFWRQMQADMYQATVATLNVAEGSALGAAILAAVGTGAYTSVPQACAKIVRTVDTIKPNKKTAKVYALGHERFGELYRNLKATFPKLADI
jgi:xylulokinase